MNNLYLKGFTIVELIVAIAIIATLSAIAIPSYQDNLNRSRFTEGMIVGQKALQDVMQYYNEKGVFPSTNDEIGFESNFNGEDVDNVTIGTDGKVCVSFDGVHLDGAILFIPQPSGAANISIDETLANYVSSSIHANVSATPVCDVVFATPTVVPTASLSPSPIPSPTVATSPTPAASPSPIPSVVPSPMPSPVAFNRRTAYTAGQTALVRGKTYQCNNPAMCAKYNPTSKNGKKYWSVV